jgi:sirohydrochlorin ferrochelatase
MSAVILLGHGSPDPRAGIGAAALAGRVADLLPDDEIRLAFLDNTAPTLTEAALTIASHADITVVPVFLSRAFHVKVDVPAEVARARAAINREITITEPIGPEPLLLEALDRQLPATAPVVLATAGTSDPEAQAAFDELAAQWSQRRGTPVLVAYASQTQPDIPAAIRQLEADSDMKSAIARFLLFDGVFPDRIKADAGDRAITAVLGDEPLLAEIIAERVLATR